MALRTTKGALVKKIEHLGRERVLVSLVASWARQRGLDPAAIRVGYVVDRQALTLQAPSKATASELFLRRGELVRLLREKGWEIRRVVIR